MMACLKWQRGLASVVLTLSACVDDAARPGLTEPPEVSATALFQASGALAPPGSIDAVFLEINQAVPGFAGMIREEGKAVVLLVDARRASDARHALASRLPDRGLAVISAETREVAYEWRELATWRAAVTPMLAFDAVISIDTNERLNRIVLGVLEGTDADAILEEAAKRGVPSEAVIVRTAEPPVLTTDFEVPPARWTPEN